MVYQMDVKSAFLYGKIREEMYACQPPGFEDPYFPNRVYKVEKALCGLHQNPRAWHETLSTYLLDNGFQKGKIDKTLFIKWNKVKQKNDGIFISQDKYVSEILKKFGFTKVKNASTPIETQKPLLKDEDREEVDVHMYRLMIGSLMYLTSSRPDIMFAVCACARYQVNPKVSHLYVVKRIFRYLKGHPKLSLWYLKDSSFDLVAYTNSDYAEASLDRKSTTGEHVADEAVYKELDDRLVRAATIASSLEAKQDTRVDSSKDKQSLSEDASKQGKSKAIDVDEDITLVNDQEDAEMFDVNDLHYEQDKGKGITIEEPVKLKKKDQIRLDEEAALKLPVELQAEFNEEQRLAIEKVQKELEANIALIETCDDVYAKINADYQMAERLQAEEQQELTDKEKATLFMQFLEKSRKFFAAKKAKEKRNKPPTQAQKTKIMYTYLKNME
nr:hypothetical protein [Tanacetum cinerariifolium]